MGDSGIGWICCQLGAREHYAVARALHQSGELVELVTDFWIDSANPARRLLPSRLQERFHPDLRHAAVASPNASALVFEARSASAGRRGWDLMVHRNDWFQERALTALARLAKRNPNRKLRLFSYSYTARRLFGFARDHGWTTVLGQIDPGPPEERLVDKLHQRHPRLRGQWQLAPRRYWQEWREECELADHVIVNSPWSREALVQEGVPESKLCTIPLAYEPRAEESRGHRREFPDAFSSGRPLRVLFLGQVNLRKGMAEILDAMARMRDEFVEFWFVGPLQLEVPAEYSNDRQARWIGGVARGDVARYYREADVFLFPTHSDGFGLTQLEAQAWGLPIIASRFCGEVVQPGVNGIVLDTVSGSEIAAAIRACIADPARLRAMSRNAVEPSRFGLDRFAAALRQVALEAHP